LPTFPARRAPHLTDNPERIPRAAAIDFSRPLVMADKAPLMARTTFVGRTAFEPSKPEGRNFLMTAEAGRQLSKPAQETLKARSEEHTSELQSRENLVCRLLLEKKKV